MLDRMHTIKTEVLGCPQRYRTESEWYEGAQTYIWMVEDNVVEVPFDREHLLETILSPTNLNKAMNWTRNLLREGIHLSIMPMIQ